MAVVPKYESSNLSDAFLEGMSFEEENIYFAANHELLDEKCKWLDDSGIQCICTVYDRRGSDCVNYCHSQECKVGLLHFVRMLKQCVPLPDELVAAMKKSSWFKFMMEHE